MSWRTPRVETPMNTGRDLLRRASSASWRVLDAVAEASGWGSPAPQGRARGIAVAESFGSYVAEVAEVSVEDGRPRVHKVWCAIDCGVVLESGDRPGPDGERHRLWAHRRSVRRDQHREEVA